MEELNDYLWETLYVLKSLYDHGKGKELFDSYASQNIDGDDCYEMALEAIGQIFEDTRCYYNEELELETNVFFDPMITEFFRLCEQYETEDGIPPKNNQFRQDLYHAIDTGFYFSSYSYNYHVYSDTSKKNGCRIVLLFGCEFCNHYEAVDGLLDVYDAFEYQLQRLKEELGMVRKGEILTLPETRTEERKAA